MEATRDKYGRASALEESGCVGLVSRRRAFCIAQKPFATASARPPEPTGRPDGHPPTDALEAKDFTALAYKLVWGNPVCASRIVEGELFFGVRHTVSEFIGVFF